MIDSNFAQATVLSGRLPIRIKTVCLEDSLGLTLAEDVHSDLDQPPFNRVSMDGIALKRETLLDSKKFQILGTISAGCEIQTLPSGNVCFEIMTGAVLPTNANLVIRYEDLKINQGEAELICDPAELNDNFHPQGSDYQRGDKVLSIGTIIKSTTTAILASVGKTHVKVFEKPRVAN